MTAKTADEKANEALALGAITAAVWRVPNTAAYPDEGPDPAIIVRFDFLNSAYRVTVERIADDD